MFVPFTFSKNKNAVKQVFIFRCSCFLMLEIATESSKRKMDLGSSTPGGRAANSVKKYPSIEFGFMNKVVELYLDIRLYDVKQGPCLLGF